MRDTILVTGAAGFAGSHLLDRLASGPDRLVGWRRPGEKLPVDHGEASMPWIGVDLLDWEAVARAVVETKPTRVYHLAGAAHVGQAWDRLRETLEVNLLGTWHLLAALRQAGLAPRILVTGSALVYRPSDGPLDEDSPVGPTHPYGFSKLAQERMALRAFDELGLPVIVTRPFNHIGPRQDASFFASSFARQIARIEAGLQEPVIVVGNLDARRDLTDVRDTVRAYQAIVERGRPGRIYNVCRGEAYTIGDILRELVAQASVPIAVRVDQSLLRPNDTPIVLGSHARIERELGWRPSMPLARTLGDLLDDWRRAVGAEA